MGFTFDLSSGKTLEESKFSDVGFGESDAGTSKATVENSINNAYATDISGAVIAEQLVPVVQELEIDPVMDQLMPESVARVDVDSFIDKFS